MQAHPAVRDALSEPDDTPPGTASNPASRVRFGFDADSPEAAERLATGEIRDAGLAAGMRALASDERQFGWMISISVTAAESAPPVPSA